MDADVALRLEQYNPWLTRPGCWPAAAARHIPDPLIPRAQQVRLRADRVSLVVGPRQAGKSTLIWTQLVQAPKPPLVLNLDDSALRDLCDSGAGFFAATSASPGRFSALFFDEVQRLDEAGLFLKSLADLKVGLPIVATGSSSWHLRARTRESLAGRAARTALYPLSFEELRAVAAAAAPPHRQAAAALELANSMMLFGGYPEVWKSTDDTMRQTVLLDLVDALVKRDASDAYRIRNPAAFRTVLRLAAGQIGNLLNMAEYASLAGISVGTVNEYLGILEESHIALRVPPFLGGKRAELTSAPKIFFVDNGLRNLLYGRFSPLEQRADRGALAENLVFSELLKLREPLDELCYWRTHNKAEVDFVVRRGEHMLPVEVKAAAMARPQIPRSLRSFIDAYRPRAALVVNLSLDTSVQVHGTRVDFRPFPAFPDWFRQTPWDR